MMMIVMEMMIASYTDDDDHHHQALAGRWAQMGSSFKYTYTRLASCLLMKIKCVGTGLYSGNLPLLS